MSDSRSHVEYYLNGLCYVGKKNITACKVLKYWRYETCVEDFKKIVEVGVYYLIFRIGKVPKNNKVSLCMMKMKEIMRIYFPEVIDIIIKTMLH